MSSIDVLMSIVAAFTAGLFVYAEYLRRELKRLDAELERLRALREAGATQAE